MSFFDNPKNFGLASVIIGAIIALTSLANIITGALEDPIAKGAIVASIGTLVLGILVLGVGLPVYNGEVTDKLTILGMFVKFIGLAVIVVGVFSGVGEYLGDASLASVLVGLIVPILIGIVMIWLSERITDGSVDTLDRILWIVLLVVFAVLAVYFLYLAVAVILAGGALTALVVGVVMNICAFILFAFLLISVLSDDVKSAMGM